MWRNIALVFFFTLFLSRLALADSDSQAANEWRVRSSAGDVSVAVTGAGDWRSLETGRVLTAPFNIQTGATGQAVLVRGDDTLLVAPQSSIEVRASVQSDAGLVTRILQSIGNIIYQVEKRPRQRFEVESPYLVSVVKGTTFTISVTERDTVVSLEEGSLEVLSKDGSNRALMKPGEIARSKPGTHRIEVSDAQAQRSQWGPWYPASVKQNSKGNTRSELGVTRLQVPVHAGYDTDTSVVSAPGLSGTAPGLSGTAPGLSGIVPGLSGVNSGVSRTPPGLAGTAPGLSGTAPGLAGTAPGLGGTAPGLSGTAPGLTK